MTASRRSCIPIASWTRRRSAKLSGIDPVYPLTEGLALGSLRRAIAQALQKLPDLPEWISPDVIRRCNFPPIRGGAEPRACSRSS